ncbi:MAG: FAD-dependent oxidoreductase [Ignavibacteriales bacterium]|nr:MAG: FAD-dependent oxidoreductase [Ignavibacteriales bacterium]
MKKCIVIGGGFAGLSAASFLCSKGFKVKLIEASPKLGGRAYSFNDKATGDVVDNGQHIMMGCYSETLSFLNLINAEKNFEFQKNLKINFVTENADIIELKVPAIPYPINLMIGLLRYRAIPLKDRLGIINFFISLFFTNTNSLNNKSVLQWLRGKKQTEKTIQSLWAIIAIGALNTNLEKASASMFANILKQIFLKGNFNSTIILPATGLSESYVKSASDYILSNGGEIKTSEQVDTIEVVNEKAHVIKTSSGIEKDFDFVLFAVPHFALNKITGADELTMIEFEYSPILTFHVWLENNNLEKTFYGLIGSELHWVFNKVTHLTIVISDAGHLIKKEDDALIQIVKRELKKYLNIHESDVKNIRIIKEKRATFVPSNKIENGRPSAKTKLKNVFLAGDWTNTNLPSTIESAVLSARLAVDEILLQ